MKINTRHSCKPWTRRKLPFRPAKHSNLKILMNKSVRINVYLQKIADLMLIKVLQTCVDMTMLPSKNYFVVNIKLMEESEWFPSNLATLTAWIFIRIVKKSWILNRKAATKITNSWTQLAWKVVTDVKGKVVEMSLKNAKLGREMEIVQDSHHSWFSTVGNLVEPVAWNPVWFTTLSSIARSV